MGWLGRTSADQIPIVVSAPFSEAVVADKFIPFTLQYACISRYTYRSLLDGEIFTIS